MRNRSRLLRETIEVLKEAVGETMAVAVRFSPDDDEMKDGVQIVLSQNLEAWNVDEVELSCMYTERETMMKADAMVAGRSHRGGGYWGGRLLIFLEKALFEHFQIRHSFFHKASLAMQAPCVCCPDEKVQQQSHNLVRRLFAERPFVLEGLDESFANGHVHANGLDKLFLNTAVKLAGLLKHHA